MPAFGLMLLIQGALAIHVLKTGRDTKWILLLIMLPGVGALAYVVLELAPDVLATRQGRQVSKRVANTLNPNKEIKDASLEYERSATVANSVRLAKECVAKGRYTQASELYRQCLTGMNEFDPDILFGLAQSEFAAGNHEEVKSVLDALILKNPDYKNQDAHLLFAMNLGELGLIEEATEEYEALVSYYTGPEPTYRYAMLLKEHGQQSKSQELLQSIIRNTALSPKHYKNMHKQWIDRARREVI